MKLGSLFDGSGGFPLAGLIAGITPVWASEIEPFAIRVTTKRLPFVKHYGDVSVVRGDSVEPVDIITFGSPCQDLSIAGKRKGLDGERSGLFMEAIRIIKEMRSKTNGVYPRFAVWENVPGAFSSHDGEDFRTVLEEFCKVKDSTAVIPRPTDGSWSDAGEIVADEYSVAWRVLDACGWGVPQRRKRIYLVADFTDQCAGEILFEPEGLSGYSAEGFRTRQSIAGCASQVSGAPKLCLNDQGGAYIEVTNDVTATLRAETHGHPPCVLEDVSFTLNTTDRHGVYAMTTGSYTQVEKDKTPTHMARDYKGPACVTEPTYGIGRDAFNQGKNAKFNPSFVEETQPTLVAKGPGGVERPEPEYTVRRLTPTECARLQGFPDWWCADLGTENPTEEEIAFWRDVFITHDRIMGVQAKPRTDKQISKWLFNPHTDSAEYKLWGNGIALPCALYIMEGLKQTEDKEK